MLQEQGGVALVAAGSPGSEGSPGLTSPACEKRKAEEDTSSDLKKVRTHFFCILGIEFVCKFKKKQFY